MNTRWTEIPAGNVRMCRAIASGASMNVIEIDAASNNGVDNIREIRDEVAYSPTEGKYKVYIIDEVHMLSIGAFNALLKTLEEPPSYVIFILATTEAHKIPVTILSRCQRYDFRRITTETIAARLRELMDTEKVEVEDRALTYIAKAADGSMRDALSLLDQCIAFYLGQKLTYEHVLEVLGAVDTMCSVVCFVRFATGSSRMWCGKWNRSFCRDGNCPSLHGDFIWYLRNLLMLKTDDNMEEMLDVSTENLVQMKEEADMTDTDTLMRYIRVLSELSGQLRYATQKRVLVELALIKLCSPAMETELRFSSAENPVLDQQKWSREAVCAPAAAGTDSLAQEKMPAAQREKLPREAMSADVRMFVDRFQELRRKMGGMQSQQLKDAVVRELPDGAGVQMILAENCRWMSRSLQTAAAYDRERTSGQMKVQVHTPHTDPRPQEPVTDLSGFIDMEIELNHRIGGFIIWQKEEDSQEAECREI